MRHTPTQSSSEPRLEPLASSFQFANTFSHSANNGPFTWELFDFPFWRQWLLQNFPLAVMCAVTYLVLVFIGRRLMVFKKPYKLKTVLVIWNISFAVFSAMAFWRTFPDLWLVLWQADGFYKSVCSRYTIIQHVHTLYTCIT